MRKPARKNRPKIVYPRRQRSVVIEPQKLYSTLDKTICADCECFKKEAPYVKSVKLIKCMKSPLTLYELAAAVVDDLPLPTALFWTMNDVANWICNDVGLPQYRECFTVNRIDGTKLLMLEDASKLPDMNIRIFPHILMITENIRKLYSLDIIRFARSHGLPLRKPLIHVTMLKAKFKSAARNWTTCDFLRRMKILNPKPEELCHWDITYGKKPHYPKAMFARRNMSQKNTQHIAQNKSSTEKFREYMTPRKFILCPYYKDQMIWQEIREPVKPERGRNISHQQPKPSHFIKNSNINISELRGKDFILAKRKMPKKKFHPIP